MKKADYQLWQRKNGVFYFRLPHGTWKSTGARSQVDAVRYVDDLLKPGESRKSLKEYAAEFFIYDKCPHIQRRLSAGKNYGRGTAKMNRSWLSRYILTDLLANRPITDIRRGDLEDFRNRLRQKTGKPNLTNKVLGVLKVVLNEAYHREEIERNPADGVDNVHENRMVRGTFTLAEIKKLFPTDGLGLWKNQQTYVAFALAAYAGLRRSEILALRWEHVHLSDPTYIRVVEAWKSDTEVGKPKWEKTRNAPLPDPLSTALRKLGVQHPAALVLCTPEGKRLGNTWWTKNLKSGLK